MRFQFSPQEREVLGRIVRGAWVDYCLETGKTERPDRIAPWESMDEWSQEVDKRIGVAVAAYMMSRAEPPLTDLPLFAIQEEPNEHHAA